MAAYNQNSKVAARMSILSLSTGDSMKDLTLIKILKYEAPMQFFFKVNNKIQLSLLIPG